MFHAVVLLAGAGSAFWSWHAHKGDVFSPLIFAVCVVALMILYPQLRFKPQLRTLVIDEKGLQTTIGKKNGVRMWREIASIEETSDRVIVTTRSMNAFLIPTSAFASEEARIQAVAQMCQWHAAR